MHEVAGGAVHLVGIGGAGMSGIARILLQRGESVTGSDLREGRSLDELRMLGAQIAIGHDAANVSGARLVVTSTAVAADNPEIRAARDRGVTVLRRAEMLARLMADDTSVLIAGTHGKTTTTSMTVVALQSAGRDPSFAIGGSLNERGTNAHAGADPLFVAEADESDRSFLVYRPGLAVVTNVELDHPDEFTSLAAVTEAFRAFLDRRQVGAPVILGADDEGSAALRPLVDAPTITYGTQPDADVRVVADRIAGRYRLRRDNTDIVTFELAVPGHHNVLNATAALTVCAEIGADLEAAATGLARFTGVARRFQTLGIAAGVRVVDDYAHHPTEVRATLAAARSVGANRVVLVVQPHRYSRTQSLGTELGRAAAAADLVVVTDVYGSNETPIPGVSGRIVADAATAAGAIVEYVPHLADITGVLAQRVGDGDLVLITGAGDITQVGPALLEQLESTRG